MSKTSSYSSIDYNAYTTSKSYDTKSKDDIFKKKQDPSTKVTEDLIRVSDANEFTPRPIPVIIGLDVTGSMGDIPHELIKPNSGLSKMFDILQDPDINVQNCQILIAAIGDGITDSAPIQVNQFEIEANKLADDLARLYLEGNGGGHGRESYAYAWQFALNHTKTYAKENGYMGYIFTIGDEDFHKTITAEELKQHFGYSQADTVDSLDLLRQVQEDWHVFHIDPRGRILSGWETALKQNALKTNEHYSEVPMLIASTIAACEGVSTEAIVNAVGKDLQTHVMSMTKNLVTVANKHVATKGDGVITLP